LKSAIILALVFLFASCGESHYIRSDIINCINNEQDWVTYSADLFYIAKKGNKDDLEKLVKLVPMATKNDCICCAGDPGDLAAYVISEWLEFDPQLSVISSLSTEDKQYLIRYYDAIQPIDWEDTRKLVIEDNLDLHHMKR